MGTPDSPPPPAEDDDEDPHLCMGCGGCGDTKNPVYQLTYEEELKPDAKKYTEKLPFDAHYMRFSEYCVYLHSNQPCINEYADAFEYDNTDFDRGTVFNDLMRSSGKLEKLGYEAP